MTNEKMMEMLEFFEMYEAFKSMKARASVSAETSAIVTSNTNVETFYNSNNLVQRDIDVVNVGETYNSNDVATKFEMYDIEVNGKKYYCIKSGIVTKKKVKDAKTGEERTKHFNISAKKLANEMIKSVDGILTIEVPIEGKSKGWNAWGFKTKKACAECLASLPKVVSGVEIDKANKEYHEKKNGGR